MAASGVAGSPVLTTDPGERLRARLVRDATAGREPSTRRRPISDGGARANLAPSWGLRSKEEETTHLYMESTRSLHTISFAKKPSNLDDI